MQVILIKSENINGIVFHSTAEVISLVKAFDITSILGGVLLVATLIVLGIFNIRRNEKKKGFLFLLAGVALGAALVKGLLFSQW